MNPEATRFDDLLRSLKDARLADEDVHRRDASLEERTASNETLLKLRAEIASLRAERALEPMETSGLHDSRARRGTNVTRSTATTGSFGEQPG